MPLTLDLNNMLAPRLGGAGVDPARLEGDLAARFREAHRDVEGRREGGEMGFFRLPAARSELHEIQEVADGFGQWFETVVVLGIGGSSLGTVTLREALLGPFWNLGTDEERDHYPRLFVLENADPATVSDLLKRLDLRRTLFNVVSKSGSTAETMAQFMVVSQALAEAVGEEKVRGHLLFTTDPEEGVLRKMAREQGIPALSVPPNVGGRFSVLSAVGLLPAAVVGIDVEALLDGAAAMEARCRTPILMENPAGMLATLLHSAHVEDGKPIHVIMPYSDRLRALGWWFQQLWAESLGKAHNRRGERVEVGPTPLPALGATDQHSQVQLFMEGPRDKVVVFIAVEDPGEVVTIPRRYEEFPSLAYLGGHSLAELLDAERRATAEALRREGRPSLTLEIPRVDAASMGELLMLFQIATVFAGALYGVDPLDQPGVELGKVLTYGLLGREGFAVPELDPGDPRWRLG